MEMHTRDSLLRTHGIESPPSSFPRSAKRRLTQLLRRFWEWRERERLIRRQIRELELSSDRQLLDIGIARSEIESTIRGGSDAADAARETRR